MIKFILHKKIRQKEPSRHNRCLTIVLAGSFFMAGLLEGGFATTFAEAAYNIDVPYQLAGPYFLDASTDAPEC